MLSLLVALVVGQVSPDSTVKWRNLTNLPGWQGYGTVLQSGWTDPVKFRRIDNPGVEYPAPGRETGFVPRTDIEPVNPATNIVVQQPVQVSGDPYGFTGWLNATRASYGLPPVGYDPNLSGWAAMNNNHQAMYGIGHFVQGPARRQNSGMGGFPGIESMWLASPAHAAALLDPTIQWIGIAGLGVYWTFNAY